MSTVDRPQRLCVLGSTGSIGTQTLDVIRRHPAEYEVYALTANTNISLLATQARQYHPACVAIADDSKYDALKALLADEKDIVVYAGAEAIAAVASADAVDVVVAAMVGFAGLLPTVRAVEAGKKICLANKETLVVAGAIICRLVAEHSATIVPIDSEHSAIYQCLAGEDYNEIEKLILTASGGPFLAYTKEQLRTVSAREALRHPTWTMGDKITIDCATLMNKGFEVIEARWLFGIPATKIEVVIHPQSIVHSAVQFRDGSVKAQLALPDMRLPIQYALSVPRRLPLSLPRLDLTRQPLEFRPVDRRQFPCLELAYHALQQGGNMPCVLNAANEVVNRAFREGHCSFLQMEEGIAQTMQRTPYIKKPTLADLVASDHEARQIAHDLLTSK